MRGIKRANTTHRATRRAKGVQKWRKSAVYPPKTTVGRSVSACFAVRHNGARQTTSSQGQMGSACHGWGKRKAPRERESVVHCHRKPTATAPLLDSTSAGLLSALHKPGKLHSRDYPFPIWGRSIKIARS